MRAIRLHAPGDVQSLVLEDIPTPTPGPGEVLIRHEAVGLNFIDIYQRTGLYPIPLPSTLGLEAAGRVEGVGEGVTRFRTGDRVAYCNTLGAYAEANVVKADRAVRLPDNVSSETAAAALLKGLTAEFLARRIWPVGSGDTVLVHAAAGGVGQILCQWLNHLGVRVIGAVGSPAKMAIAASNGCAVVLDTSAEDVAQRVRALTDGKGVKIVYDSVGAATFEASLSSLARRGMFVTFGNASGPVPAVEPLRLSRGGSLFMTRPTLFDYVATVEELDTAAEALFDLIGQGMIRVDIGQRFPLNEAARAHETLAARGTVGATILTP